MRSDVPIKLVIVILVISGLVSPALAYDVSKFQWGTGTSGKLTRGEELTYNGYTVKATIFPSPVKSNLYSGAPAESVEPFVGVNISKNGILINNTVFVQGDYYIVPDGELRITAKQFPPKDSTDWVYETYAPWAVIEMSPRGTPVIEVSVETNYNEYVSNTATEITATVTLRNTGSADVQNADMEILTALPLKRGNLKYNYEKLVKGDSITNTIIFAAPILSEIKNYEITANATGYDAKELFYNGKASKSILIAPEPEQVPTIRKNVNTKIYLGEYAMVSINIKNNANYELKNVSISDSLPAGFKLLSNNSLQWVVTIPAGEERDFRYFIKPLEANKNGAVLPSATAEFSKQREYYAIRSNQPSIIVHGPKISLNKQTDVSEIKPGDTVTVTVIAENAGSTPTKVSISDRLPPEGTLVSGGTALEDFLEAGKTIRFSYVLQLDSEQPIKLPPAAAEYYELNAKSGRLSTVSNEPEIQIKSLKSSQGENGNEAPPSFEITAVPPEIVPAETPELPFTPIVEEEPVPQTVPAPQETAEPEPPRVTAEEISSVIDILMGCKAASITGNEPYNVCSLIKKN